MKSFLFRLLLLLPLGIYMLTTGCSYLISYYVVNLSDAPISITCNFVKEYKDADLNDVPDYLAVIPYDETFGFEDDEFRKLSEEEYEYDPVSGLFRYELEGGSALKFQISREGLEAKTLTIESQFGMIKYEGEELYRAFEKYSIARYVYYYK